jgi:hypothetical protein
MVITEAAIQAAHHNLGQVVPCTEVDARFYRYLELSEKAFIEISVIGENRVSVCFVQADQVGAEIVLHFEGLHQPASKNRQDPYAESESEE